MPIKKRPAKKGVKKKGGKRKAVKKRLVRKAPALKRAARGKKPAEKENLIGVVTHYFPHVRAAVVKLKAPLSVGDVLKIKGHTTDFQQSVNSMQINHVPINQAKKGDEIGLLVDSRVRQHDRVYKV